MIESKLTKGNTPMTDTWRSIKPIQKKQRQKIHYEIKSNDGKHIIKGLYHI